MNNTTTAPTTEAKRGGESTARVRRIALTGNPNTGKTSLFNALTGLNQKVANYPGVTVERKSGRFSLNGEAVELIDLPGSYSLAARSLDEVVVNNVLLGEQKGEGPIDLVLVIVDASNLLRNLYFLSQLLEIGLPVVVALNMVDIARSKGIDIDAEGLSASLGAPVVKISAHRRKGIDELKAAMSEALAKETPRDYKTPEPAPALSEGLATLRAWIESRTGEVPNPTELQRALIDEGSESERRLVSRHGAELAALLNETRHAASQGLGLTSLESKVRYEWGAKLVSEHLTKPDAEVITLSNRIDKVLTHRVWGTAIFIAIMALIFQSIYSWAGPFMDIIDGTVSFLGGAAAAALPAGALQSLVADGIFAGVGSVIIFLPQIAILFFFLAILEDCGYLPRAAYLVDRLLAPVGLSGKSFIPLLSSFACAIPGVMATRTIEDRRERMVTIMVAPLMSCSARLPVYLIFIAAFVPNQAVFGSWFNLQGLALLGMYLVGVLVAIPVALIANRLLSRKQPAAFVLEMPTYKMPSPRNVLLYVYERAVAFLYRAGTIIFAATIVVWALAYFPRSSEIQTEYAEQRQIVMNETAVELAPVLSSFDGEQYSEGMAPEAMIETALADPRLGEDGEGPQTAVEALSGYQDQVDALDRQESGALLRNSFLGRMGHVIEPAVEPLGWDWRIGMATIASFPAREVIVATLGTIFNLGAEVDEESDDMITTLQNAKRADGSPLFSLAVAISIMVFFALCSQCVSTLAVIKRETNSWRWPVFSFVYMTVLAYIGAFLAYQGGVFLGWG